MTPTLRSKLGSLYETQGDSTITAGTRVNAGDLVGYNGDSGNARGGPTHVHFEVHPSQGAPTNPYPWLRAVCP